jgi:hypothetical protein
MIPFLQRMLLGFKEICQIFLILQTLPANTVTAPFHEGERYAHRAQ